MEHLHGRRCGRETGGPPRPCPNSGFGRAGHQVCPHLGRTRLHLHRQQLPRDRPGEQVFTLIPCTVVDMYSEERGGTCMRERGREINNVTTWNQVPQSGGELEIYVHDSTYLCYTYFGELFSLVFILRLFRSSFGLIRFFDSPNYFQADGWYCTFWRMYLPCELRLKNIERGKFVLMQVLRGGQIVRRV